MLCSRFNVLNLFERSNDDLIEYSSNNLKKRLDYIYSMGPYCNIKLNDSASLKFRLENVR